jgi:hypothetical protein
MKGVLIFKMQVYQKLEVRFTPYEHSFLSKNIFYKTIFTTTSTIYKIA